MQNNDKLSFPSSQRYLHRKVAKCHRCVIILSLVLFCFNTALETAQFCPSPGSSAEILYWQAPASKVISYMCI